MGEQQSPKFIDELLHCLEVREREKETKKRILRASTRRVPIGNASLAQKIFTYIKSEEGNGLIDDFYALRNQSVLTIIEQEGLANAVHFLGTSYKGTDRRRHAARAYFREHTGQNTTDIGALSEEVHDEIRESALPKTLYETLNELERRVIYRSVEEARGNLTKATGILKTNTESMWRRMKVLELDLKKLRGEYVVLDTLEEVEYLLEGLALKSNEVKKEEYDARISKIKEQADKWICTTTSKKEQIQNECKNLEREVYSLGLRMYKGKITPLAEQTTLSRSGVTSKIKKLGIDITTIRKQATQKTYSPS